MISTIRFPLQRAWSFLQKTRYIHYLFHFYTLIHFPNQYKIEKGWIIKIWFFLPWEQALQSIASRFLWFLRYIHETETWVLSLEPFLLLGLPSSQIPVNDNCQVKTKFKLDLITTSITTSTTHSVDFVTNEHLNAVMVSRVELNLFGPNICQVQKRLSFRHIINCIIITKKQSIYKFLSK